MQVEQGDPVDQVGTVPQGQQPGIFAGYRRDQDMRAGVLLILRASDSTPLPCPEAE
jgi:hypothetical protein